MRLVLAGLKGGVGKTTSAVFLAEAASRDGRVLLVDADPQQSLTRWAEVSKEMLPAAVIGLATTKLGRQLDGIAHNSEYVIIDTPPGHLDITQAAMSTADLIVVPIGGTLIELDRLRPTLDLTEQLGKPTVALLVRQRKTRLAAEVESALVDHDVPVLQATIPYRAAIEGAFGTRPVEDHGYRDAWEELKSIGRKLNEHH